MFVGIRRYIWLLVPVVLMLALTVAMESLVSVTDNVWAKGIVAGLIGVVGLVVIITAVRWIASRLQVSAPIVTGWRSLAFAIDLISSLRILGCIWLSLDLELTGQSMGDVRWHYLARRHTTI